MGIPGCKVEFSVLGSGSRGNSVYVRSGQTEILIDAGFSGKEIENRLHRVGQDAAKLSSIFLTHEHHDHIVGAGVMSRRFKLPVFANHGTFSGSGAKLGKLHELNEFATGDKIQFQDLEIRSFRVSHDTLDPVGYVIDDGTVSIGYCTDTGKVTHLMAERLSKCNGLIFEFNHDPEMLKNGPYPLALQQRVRSAHGHLANADAAAFLKEITSQQLQVVVLAHLSETNNLPELAYNAALANGLESETTIIVATQNKPGHLISLT